MSKGAKSGDQKQISFLLPIEGKPQRTSVTAKVVYRSPEFYEIRQKLVKSLPNKKPVS